MLCIIHLNFVLQFTLPDVLCSREFRPETTTDLSFISLLLRKVHMEYTFSLCKKTNK